MKKIRKKYPHAVIDPTTGLQDLAKQINLPSVCRFADSYGGIIYHDRKLTREEYDRLLRLVEKI